MYLIRHRFDYKTLFYFSGGVLLAFMLIFPQDMYLPKIICMSLMLICCKGKLTLSTQVILIWGLLISACIWGIISGLINNSEEPLKYLSIHLVWPTLVLIFISQIHDKSIYNRILRLIIICHFLIVVYDLVYASGIIFGFYVPDLNPTHEMPMFSYYGYTSRMNFINLNTITFTAPILIFIWLTNYKSGFSKLFINVLLLLIISGRRSLMAEFLIIIPISLVFYKFLDINYRKNLKKRLLFFISLSILAIFLVYLFDQEQFIGYWNTFTSAFDSQEEPVKFAQKKMLIEQFEDNPIFGVGVGKFMYEPSPGRAMYRNTFELMYHLWLAQTGIVGFVLYCLSFFSLLIFGFYISCKRKDTIFFFFLLGYLAIIMAHATNPVMNSFDFMISFFLCLANLNTDLLYN